MKIHSFFKILKNKIEKYDKVARNPFTEKQPVVLIWINSENPDEFFTNDYS